MNIRVKRWAQVVAVSAMVALVATAGYMGFRAKRTYSLLRDWQAQIRHVINGHETIGEAPAARTFEASYLEAVFGGEPELLNQLRGLIAKGIAEDPTINMGEVSAMAVTYTKSPEGKIEDVAVHVLGGFEIGRRRPAMNHDGFFAAQIDHNLWNSGNTLLGLLGRDMIVFADPKVSHLHDEILEATLSGDILPLVGLMTNRTLYFTAVFPDPKRIMPAQLRTHIQTCIFKGSLSRTHGNYDALFLARDTKSAGFALSIVNDLRLAAMLAMKTHFDGVVHKTPWGDHVSTWWAYEMANMIGSSDLKADQNIISVKTSFERPMVNANLKAIERMGRDMAAMRLIRDDRLDPRLADAQLKSQKPLHYWNDAHQWGPDWPIPPVETNGLSAAPAPTQQK